MNYSQPQSFLRLIFSLFYSRLQKFLLPSQKA